jgi:hypothetical protein
MMAVHDLAGSISAAKAIWHEPHSLVTVASGMIVGLSATAEGVQKALAIATLAANDSAFSLVFIFNPSILRRYWLAMNVMKSPFSMGVQGRPSTLSQLRPNHFSVSWLSL